MSLFRILLLAGIYTVLSLVYVISCSIVKREKCVFNTFICKVTVQEKSKPQVLRSQKNLKNSVETCDEANEKNKFLNNSQENVVFINRLASGKKDRISLFRFNKISGHNYLKKSGEIFKERTFAHRRFRKDLKPIKTHVNKQITVRRNQTQTCLDCRIFHHDNTPNNSNEREEGLKNTNLAPSNVTITSTSHKNIVSSEITGRQDEYRDRKSTKQATNNCSHTTIKIAVLVPEGDSFLFSRKRVQPSTELAVETLRRRGLLGKLGCHGGSISVAYGDTKCSATHGLFQVFQFMKNSDEVGVFIGPTCDYSLAPAARLCSIWKKPMITTGGFANDFGEPKRHRDAEFSTLTRMSVTFNLLTTSVFAVVEYYGWRRLKVVYDVKGYAEVMPKFCYLAASSIVGSCKRQDRVECSFHIYTPSSRPDLIRSMLTNEIGTKISSEFHL